MSFRKNDTQQISFSDSLYGLTEREKKALEKSWAKVFADEVFPSINEDRFRVLYSEKDSRPNTPVNIIIGALVLKELFGLSDDGVVETLMFDHRFQYALHTTSFEEQPLSDKSLSRFRIRCYDYESTHGVDLYHDCVKDLAEKTAKMMKIDGRIRRMDSMMLEANIRKLSRMELIYTCIAKLVRWLNKNGHADLIHGMEHYCDPNDFNQVIYHAAGAEVDTRMDTLLSDADSLLKSCQGKYEDITEYQLFVRCMSDQTIVENEKRRLKGKQDGGMNSDMLQNPSDPEATFRKKAGKEHRGYVANFEESVGENGSVVTDYAVEQNNTGDSVLLKNHLNQMDKQEEKVIMIADGAYSGTENQALAEEKNVELITTDLTGKDVDPIFADFEFNEDGTRVITCPVGNQPKGCTYIKQSGMCRVSFFPDQCQSCPHRNECQAKLHKRTAIVMVSLKKRNRAQLQKEMKSDKYKLYGRIRNGVETVPSILRNVYHADRVRARGTIRISFFTECKLAALNFRKLFIYRKGLGRYAQNPLLVPQIT